MVVSKEQAHPIGELRRRKAEQIPSRIPCTARRLLIPLADLTDDSPPITPRQTSMTRLAVTTALLMLVFSSCSAATKPPAVSARRALPVVAVRTPADGGSADASKPDAPPPAVAPPVRLAPGTCNETFDCDDTCALPPSGSRWDCRQRQCVLMDLPNLSPQPEPTEATPVVPAAKKVKVKKSAKQKT